MYGAAIVPYQGGPDIRLAPSALPFYPVGRSGQHDICLWRKNIGRFDEPRRDRCQPHIIIHVVADVPFLWERCCQNTLLGVNYTLCKHGFQQAIVLKHHYHSASLCNSCDLYCTILPNFLLVFTLMSVQCLSPRKTVSIWITERAMQRLRPTSLAAAFRRAWPAWSDSPTDLKVYVVWVGEPNLTRPPWSALADYPAMSWADN